MWGRGGGSRFLLAGLIVSAFVLLLYWWFGRDLSRGPDVGVVYMGGFLVLLLAGLLARVSSALLWPCPKHANPPHGGPRAILQLQSLRWSTIAAATMSRSEAARGGLLRSVEPAGSRQLRDFPDMRDRGACSRRLGQ